MKIRSPKTWQFMGSFTLVIYLILTTWAWIFFRNYESDPTVWDLGGIIPLILVNIPGLVISSGIVEIFGTVDGSTSLGLLFIFGFNIIFYFTFGALIGFVVDSILTRVTVRKRLKIINPA